MILRAGTVKNTVHLYALNIGPQLLEWEWDTFLQNLPNEEQVSVLKYKYWEDRQRTLLGKVLIRWMIRNLTDVRDIQINRNKIGRPYLVGTENWDGDFNLSHSGNWIVAALTNRAHVGVDVEKINHLSEDVMVYAMSEAELTMINQKPQTDRINLFYELWTMKEAIYKTGLFPNATLKSLDTVELKSKRKDIHTQLFYMDREHPVSICWNGKQLPVCLTTLNRNQLF